VASHYEVVTRNRAGNEHVHRYTSNDALSPGDVLRLEGRDWLVVRIEATNPDGGRVVAAPAQYRLRLRHPDGREELGALRRYRPDAPRLGHSLTTIEDGVPASWAVVYERLAEDPNGGPYLDLVAERDFDDLDTLADHQLEHAVVARDDDLPPGAAGVFARAEEAGLALELVALDPGEDPDWEEAAEYIGALILEEISDYLLPLCGVDTDREARDSWLPTVQERLRADLESFRADIEGDHDGIEEWSFRDGRIFASVGSADDEADRASGHGWMCRLLDSGALAAAGFERVRKASL